MRKEKKKQFDLWGNEIITDPLLRDKFIEPPFSVLDTKSGSWKNRKREWADLGIKSEVGRDAPVLNIVVGATKENNWKAGENYTSIFDPALCEVLYHWFVPEGGEIFDPFAGGSVRGIVAHYLGYKYTGFDIRDEQIQSNIEQAKEILAPDNQPNWFTADTSRLKDNWSKRFDFIFSCPPYGFLEKYSDLKGDISNMTYPDFLKAYNVIIQKSCRLLKPGGFACFVVGEFRDKKGNYVGFVPDTVKAFQNAGLKYYNEGILLNSLASASVRAGGNMKSKKLVKIHQNVLVFKKD